MQGLKEELPFLRRCVNNDVSRHRDVPSFLDISFSPFSLPRINRIRILLRRFASVAKCILLYFRRPRCFRGGAKVTLGQSELSPYMQRFQFINRCAALGVFLRPAIVPGVRKTGFI